MTRRRIYIQKEEKNPEFDLWLELNNQFTAVPEIALCCNGENGKETIVSLTAMTAARLHKVLEELIAKCSEPVEDYVTETEIDDQIGAH